MGLLDASYSAVNTKKPRNSEKQYQGEDVLANASNAIGLFSDFLPMYGSAKSAVNDYESGNYVSSAANGFGALIDMASLPAYALKSMIGLSVTKPGGVKAITEMMSDASKAADTVPVGFLEKNHMQKWGKSGDASLFFGANDVEHTQKRLREGLLPSEIADIAYRATQKNAHPMVTGKNDLLLTSPIPMKFEDSPLFKPQAVIRQEDDGMHLYGVVPKGWKGRDK